MATYCKTCIGALCDFCAWYDFNADADGGYAGAGHCRFHGRPSEPTDACDDFVCRVTLRPGEPSFAAIQPRKARDA